MKNTTDQLKAKAKEIRKSVICALMNAESGHLGGSLGMADIFTVLYFSELNYKAAQPYWYKRDRLILSIGHIAPVYYATLAHAGYFQVDELQTLRKLGSRLQGHPATVHRMPGLETSAGSLGQGLSIGVGMALAAKHASKNHRIFSIHGDGELQEGSIWEAAMAAGYHNLNNLISIVDRNQVQIDGPTSEVMNIEPLIDKWRAFNWNVYECNGNDIEDILNVFDEIKQQPQTKPQVIIAHTKMGAGVQAIEGDYKWHGKAPTKFQTTDFIKQLNL